jgi:CRP-like cAMP-binding protein
VLIATRGAGDIVGEMSLLTPGASSLRSASVRARSREVRCSVISKEELWRSLRERPEALEELRLRSVGRESELIVGRALLSTGAVAATSP